MALRIRTPSLGTAGTFIRNAVGPGISAYDMAMLQGRLWTPRYLGNLALQSENFAATWTAAGSVISAAQAQAPDTAKTAGRLTESTNSERHIAYQVVTVTAGSRTHVWSAFLKEGTQRYAQMQTSNGTGFGAIFDLRTGTVTDTRNLGSPTGTGSGIYYVGDGWYRCWVKFTFTTNVFALIATSDGPTPSYDGNGNPTYLGTSKYILVWGAHYATDVAHPPAYVRTTTAAITPVGTVDDQSRIEGYESWRYGRKGSLLTASHRYQNAPPLIGETATRRRIPGPGNVAAGGAGAQDLTPSLFTNTATFFAATVTVGAVTLTPALFTNTQTFHAPTVSAGAVTLTPDLFTNGQTFFAPTVAQGAVTLEPALFTNGQTFYSATVSAGAVTLTPALFTNAQTFHAATVTTGAVTLTPGLFTNAQTFYSAVVAGASAIPSYLDIELEGTFDTATALSGTFDTTTALTGTMTG